MVRATVNIGSRRERPDMVLKNKTKILNGPLLIATPNHYATTALEKTILRNQRDTKIINSNIVRALEEAKKQHCKQNCGKQQKVIYNTQNMISLREELL